MDKITGAYQTVNTSKSGARGRFFRQFASCVFVFLSILILKSVIEIVVGIKNFGIENFSLPIQQWEMYEMCPFRLTIADFFVIKFLVKFLLYSTICSVTALISTVIKKPLIANISGVIVACGGLLLHMIFYNKCFQNPTSNLTNDLKIFNFFKTILPQGLLNVKTYFMNFDYTNFLGNPVNRLTITVTISAIILISTLVFGYVKSGKRAK
jgi:hypothetical protein